MDTEHLDFLFTSEALENHDIRVREITGREQIGRLYEFRVRFTVEAGPLSAADVDALLAKACSFTLGTCSEDVVHGIVREVDLVDAVEGFPAVYVAVVVPSVWLLTLSRLSRVYQNVTVLDIAREIFMRFGMSEQKDFEIRGYGKPAKRELYVQYEESDWDFLQRWFERDGLYYWFEHDDQGEKLIVADDTRGSKPIPGDSSLAYRDYANLAHGEDSIFAWSGRKQRTVGRVVLKDYNERNPALPMVAQADADTTAGFGVHFAYGEHFTDADAGKLLATYRAERLLVDQTTVRGTSDCPRLRVGHRFEMWNHFSSDQNAEYLLTAIDHKVSLTERVGTPRGAGYDVAPPSTRRERLVYRASFEAIPKKTQYRAARVTPWPRIDGVMHAHVDSDTDGNFSTLNEEGRYRIRLPFDSTGNQGEAASSWVRMAQSYAGAGYGSHFPLHKGAEVVVAFVQGNPDRPIIVGAVPNAHTPGPSARKNASQSVVQSASGIRFVMDDEQQD
jgi:type VI secretion system secreted protein VgrG